ncbi:MAG: MaoC family dehydratase [Desulfobacteraceae bacterium]|jgi:3-hydroxybutyryl-CoA dehydratase
MKTRLEPDDITVGEELHPLKKIITQEKINTYVSAAEDYNPIHVDPEFAKKTPFKSTIAPGYQVLAYLSEMMSRDFGEKWITGGVMDVRLLKPVFPGDELRIGARLAEKRKEKSDYFISFEVWIKNQRNEDVVVGHASVTY